MRDHIRILAILHIALSSLGLLAAIIVLFVFGGIAGIIGIASDVRDVDRATGMGVMGIIGCAVFCLILIFSLPGLIAGIGLLKLRSWSRVLTIVLSALDLLSVPIGTAVGIYGLWVLLQPGVEGLFVRQGPVYSR
ncbi:MAG TPA: hypothetical protein VMJ34_04220 [Bryobacteraceae bacterium]|nr:hypothetical protein [Bryobacteraceae bacterium]